MIITHHDRLLLILSQSHLGNQIIQRCLHISVTQRKILHTAFNAPTSTQEEKRNLHRVIIPFEDIDEVESDICFASFWNRNHALRALQRAAKHFHTMVEDEKKRPTEAGGWNTSRP
ncbi:BAG-associated GRAM protein 1 [Camellia lanceoleosa]|uniref:BAG-associated GRAM protein 1 n=1 Tax=Camellia lanceoleosa TaxID=1840588 RepID=A0ACC0I783_9ERIC|nr:BAG-associated GRAM protein 1 [Camellia lanceoleosa]